MTSNEPQRPYDIGYGRPPRHTRWKPGESGNPTGKRRRKPTVSERIEGILARKLTVGAGAEARRISLEDVIFEKLAHASAHGDLKATRLLMDLRDRYRANEAEQLDPDLLEPNELAIIESYMASAGHNDGAAGLGEENSDTGDPSAGDDDASTSS